MVRSTWQKRRKLIASQQLQQKKRWTRGAWSCVVGVHKAETRGRMHDKVSLGHHQSLTQRGNLVGFFGLRMMDECNRRIERSYYNWHCLGLSVTPCSRQVLRCSQACGLQKISSASAVMLTQHGVLHSALWLCHGMSGKFFFLQKLWFFWLTCKRKRFVQD